MSTRQGASPPEGAWVVNPHVRAHAEDDGTVLMDLFRGKYYSFNPVGALVWSGLDAGRHRDEIVDSLVARFSTERRRVELDVDRLLHRLAGLGLVSRSVDGQDEGGERPEQPAPALASRPGAFGRPTDFAALPFDDEDSPAVSRLSGVATSYLLLIGVDLVLRLVGFRRFHQMVRRVRVRDCTPDDPKGVLRRVRHQVDEACRLYLKRAWCMQRSAVTAVRLRRRGIPAELVIGVRRVPFLAHAWVEVGGTVVNDDARVQRFYHALERC